MNNGHYDFIEIGTSDFDTLIELSDDNTFGLSIEPIRYYLDRLPNKKNVKKLQVAISDNDGHLDIYYIPDDKIQEHSLPWWVRGSNSINHPHPFTIKEIGEELYNSIVKIDKVPAISWDTLVKQENIQSIGFLKIDTEGFDHVILKDYLKTCETNPKLLADKIKFECHKEVSNLEEIEKLIPKFKNYHIERHESDITLTKVKIPRIIHQTFKSQDLPDELKSWVEELKSRNPEFEYRFYNDEDCINFIQENYDKETLDEYLSINPNYGSCRADYFRYLLMYKVGGVYLDIKSFANTPLKYVIKPTDEYILTHWEGRDWSEELNYYHGEFQNWQIISIPGHPFLKKTIEMVKENIKNYKGEMGKNSVLHLTGPVVYSKAILSLLDKHKIDSVDSPVREFKISEELGLTYRISLKHQHFIYGHNSVDSEPIIMKKTKDKKAYVLYATDTYLDIVTSCAKSIREFSDLPIYVYMLNSPSIVDVPNTKTIQWFCNITSDNNLYKKSGDNFFIDRSNSTIYNILIQRPLITKNVLENYAETVAYVDSDSIATPYVDRIFDMYDNTLTYPYFVEGIYDYLHIDGRGGADSRDDLSTTLEHPACELFNVDQYVRQEYRQTGYYVAGQNTLDFLDEWYWMCINPKVLNNFNLYAPYHEETIVNILLWKNKIFKGLPYCYINGSIDMIDKVYNEFNFNGVSNHISSWVRTPANLNDLLFYHGEKRINIMNEMIDKIKSYNNKPNKLKILFLAPHLSTGGMPSFLLKRIQSLQKYSDLVELFVVEYSNHSDYYVVQKNMIKEIIPTSNFWTLGKDKTELLRIIKNNNIDIVHIDDVIEELDIYNPIPKELIEGLYSKDRSWRIVETCHNVSFRADLSKVLHPEAYAYCTPYHEKITFKDLPSYGETILFPIENNPITDEEKIKSKEKLGFDLNKIHVVNVGLWTKGKNQGEGVELAKSLVKSNPEIHFHFVGNQAPNFEEYWSPIMKSIPNNVTVWGERADANTFMMAADIFMFNSTWECNPLVLREAASYGLKILSRNLPQYMDMFTPYITEIDNNINSTKAKLLSLINNKIKYKIPQGQFDNFGEQYFNFYNKVKNIEIKKQNISNINIQVIQHFVNQPYFEIKGSSDKVYNVKFFDEKNYCHYENKLPINHWIKLNRQYFTKWRTEVWDENELIYENTLDFSGKRVYIALDSKSLGDTIAWIPYMLEFKKKHNCHLIVSTFWNKLFKKSYPEIEFIEPGITVNNLNGMYKLGWFYNSDSEPEIPNTIPLQKTATNILGLEFSEILPKMDFTPKSNPFKEKYVTIANESTSGLKYWNNPNGWQELVNYLVDKGYKVINVSKNGDSLKNVTKLKDTSIENTMNVIHHSEFFIGLSSGLSWLSWAIRKHVVMISNFTEADHEFTINCTRITNPSVCNGCWNNPNFKFDKGDWYWCPEHKNTPRQFECHKSITSEMVINSIQHLIK